MMLEAALVGLGEAAAGGTLLEHGQWDQDRAGSLALASLGGLLTEAAFACGALHAMAHRAYASTGDGNLADLADAQMQAYLTAAAAIGEVVSEVAVWELEQAGMECACHCSACAMGICLCARHGKEMVARARENAASRPGGEGITVLRLPAGSHAALAGLQPDDVIVVAGKQPIAGPIDLLRAIRDLPAEADVALTITRGDTTREIVVSRA
jgi:membrane-associated protease RseP (regulator of RpoE activity)